MFLYNCKYSSSFRSNNNNIVHTVQVSLYYNGMDRLCRLPLLLICPCCGSLQLTLAVASFRCVKVHLHRRCGSGVFAERCDFNRNLPIFSNRHRWRQRQHLMCCRLCKRHLTVSSSTNKSAHPSLGRDLVAFKANGRSNSSPEINFLSEF